MSGQTASNDLRNRDFFEKWVASLPLAERDLLTHAAMEYLESDDTVRIVCVHNSSLQSEQSGAWDRLLGHIRAHYDECRAHWMINTVPQPDLLAPKAVVMPRVVFQPADPKHATH